MPVTGPAGEYDRALAIIERAVATGELPANCVAEIRIEGGAVRLLAWFTPPTPPSSGASAGVTR